jgi:glycerol-3-phosphate dehydrogenase
MSLEALRKGLRKRSPGAEAREDRGSLVLEGRVSSWKEKVELGFYAAGAGYRGVVNDLVAEGCEWAEAERPSSPFAAEPGHRPLEGLSFDAVIIGGGVIGCAIARELTRWRIKVLLLEKEEDVAVHTSSRNDGMIHDGFAARPGSLKAQYNVLGNRLWEGLAADLGIEFRRPGSLLVFRNAAIAALYPVLASRAAKNGVDGWDY